LENNGTIPFAFDLTHRVVAHLDISFDAKVMVVEEGFNGRKYVLGGPKDSNAFDWRGGRHLDRRS